MDEFIIGLVEFIVQVYNSRGFMIREGFFLPAGMRSENIRKSEEDKHTKSKWGLRNKFKEKMWKPSKNKK